jgi:hypothetical protein
MPIATPAQYRELIDAARAGSYAYPAVNVSSSETLNAAMRGFAEAGSDGIVQISTGGGEFASGGAVEDMALGAKALAEYARVLAGRYPILIVLHTDHCPPDKLDRFLRPLLAESVERRARGEEPLFGSHMFDGSSLPLEENLAVAGEAVGGVRCGGRRSRGGVRSRRRGGGRRQRRRHASREAVHDDGGPPSDRPGARHRRTRSLPARGHVRKRPRRVRARKT